MKLKPGEPGSDETPHVGAGEKLKMESLSKLRGEALC
jgi:hypothetical protein